MKISSKNFLVSVVILSLLIGLSHAIFVYLVDPYQIYRKHFLVEQQFFSNSRYQNAGLINSYLNSKDGYDAMIIGTSMSRDLDPHYVKDQLSWGKVLNFSMSGGRGLEKKVVAEAALKTGKVQQVIWEVYYYEEHDIHATQGNEPFPDYLYHYSIDDYQYLLSRDVLLDSIKLIKSNVQGRPRWNGDLNAYSLHNEKDWLKGIERFNSQNNLQTLRKRLARVRKRQDWNSYSYDYTDNFPNIDVNLLTVINQYPEVNFYFFFPPNSTYKYAVMNFIQLNRNLSTRRYLVEKLKDYDNVEIYGLDNIKWIVNDLANYYDRSHYSIEY